MENLLRDLKAIYHYYIDDDGNLLNMPRGTEFSYVPAQNREFIGRFVKFCMTTKILNENSHIYIKSHFRSVREVFEDYNQNHKDNPLNVRTCISKIDYDRKKLHKYFDADLINLMMFRVVKGVGKLPSYEKQLAAAMEVYSRGDLFEDKLVIKLDKTMNPEMPDREKIAKFLEIIAPYRKGNLPIISDAINNDYRQVIGYLNFINKKEELSDEEKSILKLVENYISCKAADISLLVDGEGLDDDGSIDYDDNDFELEIY